MPDFYSTDQEYVKRQAYAGGGDFLIIHLKRGLATIPLPEWISIDLIIAIADGLQLPLVSELKSQFEEDDDAS